SYVGIGVSVNSDENGILTVIEPMVDSPAEKAGLKKGDKIVTVDDTDVTAIKDDNMIISMIKGTEGTTVKITVYRSSEGKYIDFEIIRTKIKVVNIKSEVLDNNIGYIKLSMFDSEMAADFENHLGSLLQKGIKGLIIDLRDDPGGSYSQVCKIADRLLPEGTIVYTEDRAGKREVKTSDAQELGLPLAVLVNGNSASASEILAGAVKDYKKGILVGTKTFGKGVVQEIQTLSDGSGLKITVSSYFTPSGVSIHGVGIEPDIKVEVATEYADYSASRIPRDKDDQLKAAIDALVKEMAK
ncbi:MAG: S41 family peptidase, partial [Clostridiales bacterium]|nr:S41 family peptidase [Clostridiales bacterium]